MCLICIMIIRVYDGSMMLNYKYSFQGQETDPETGMEAFQLRLWDGRLGRWMSPDPYGQNYSPYLGMGNNPISSIDPDGGWETKFGAWWNNLWTGGQGTIFQSERGDWGLKYEGQVINGEVTVYSPRFGGERYGSVGAEIRAYEPNFFGRIQENYLNSNTNDNFLKSSLKTLGKVGYNIADDAFVYGTRNFTTTGAMHLNRDGASPKEVLNSGLNTITTIFPSPIKMGLVSKFNVATFGSTFEGTFLTKLAPATRGTIIRYTNVVMTQLNTKNFITATKSASKKINQQ